MMLRETQRKRLLVPLPFPIARPDRPGRRYRAGVAVRRRR